MLMLTYEMCSSVLVVVSVTVCLCSDVSSVLTVKTVLRTAGIVCCRMGDCVYLMSILGCERRHKMKMVPEETCTEEPPA